MSPMKIVVGLDRSREANQALLWALDEAERTHADVEIVYAWVWPAYMPAASMVPGTSVWPDSQTEAAIATMITETLTAARNQHSNLTITSHIGHGPAALVLRDRADHADLLVVGGRSHNAAAGLLLGSVATAVAAHATCSVAVVRGGYQSDDDRPVVVGIDDSRHADPAIRFAFEEAAARKVALHVVQAWTPPRDPWIGPPFDRDEIDTAERGRLRDQLAGWQDKYPAVPVTAHVVGHPYQILDDAARSGQLIVVPALGRGGFTTLRLGSVTRHLLSHCPNTVAVIRDPRDTP